jgi:hypothetical protein
VPPVNDKLLDFLYVVHEQERFVENLDSCFAPKSIPYIFNLNHTTASISSFNLVSVAQGISDLLVNGSHINSLKEETCKPGVYQDCADD